MLRKICLWAFALITLFSCSQVRQVSQHRDIPNAIPVLRITNDTSASAIKISTLDIDINIAANIATTTFDITFHNPNNRVLEGELEFPLADGQHVIRYALDINGKLREGVVVDKAKARVAFENTIRRKIDPGLIEKTKGNNFRTRIYPLPANGTRHIVIAIEQALEYFNKDLLYQLPLKAAEAIDRFSIKASVVKSADKPSTAGTNLSRFDFARKENNWAAEYAQNNFKPNHTARIIIPAPNETNSVIAENINEISYFYVNAFIKADQQEKQRPKTIGVLWDISASAEKRDLQKEIKLLKQWLSEFNSVQVSLLPFNISVQRIQQFDISAGNSHLLIQQLEALTYDGGTQIGSIDCNVFKFDEILFFSDGLSTFGKKEMIFSGIPVTTISSSASADISYLKYVAEATNGKFIDLAKLEINDAVDEISNQSFEIIKAEFNPSEIEELVLQTGPVQNSGLSSAGKLKTNEAIVKIHLGFGNKVTQTKTFTITKPVNSDYENVKRIWAEMKIAELDLRFERNKKEITALGKQYSIVTQNTSLIVLDRVEDYVEHEITPPEELKKEYFALLKEKQRTKENDKTVGLNQALEALAQMKEWWLKKHSPIKVKDSLITVTDELTSTGRVAFMRSNVTFQSDSIGALFYSTSPGLGAVSGSVANGHDLNATVRWNSADDRFEEELKKAEPPAPAKEIEINEWKSNAEYLKEIEKVSPNDRKAKYYSLKKQYLNQPSFFIDIARFFLANNEKQLGLLVLSNVAEMKLEDAELLRMMANELLETNENEAAIETFREILKLREEHPHSYRDLALALDESGKHNEALELLYKVITGTWDLRFGDIRSIAINEMNAIISANKASVNTSSIDQRLIYPMPVDVRIVLGWNTDNSDIDLWVTDPRNERCSYDHTQTEIGGKISQDVTGGFGPEEFCLKNAWKGNYTIEANLYGDTRQTLGGPITIKAELFTDFGKPTQKRELINFRVTTNKETVKIGALKI